jgi:hypothetical protein
MLQVDTIKTSFRPRTASPRRNPARRAAPQTGHPTRQSLDRRLTRATSPLLCNAHPNCQGYPAEGDSSAKEAAGRCLGSHLKHHGIGATELDQ